MEIEVGEYGRTNKGKIFIFAWLERESGILDENKVILGNGKIFKNELYHFGNGEKIVKHSKNIIDLIEPGDYVNGYLCRYITDINTGEEYMCNFDLNLIEWTPLKNIDIWDNILTHEQYENNCYKVVE